MHLRRLDNRLGLLLTSLKPLPYANISAVIALVDIALIIGKLRELGYDSHLSETASRTGRIVSWPISVRFDKGMFKVKISYNELQSMFTVSADFGEFHTETITRDSCIDLHVHSTQSFYYF